MTVVVVCLFLFVNSLVAVHAATINRINSTSFFFFFFSFDKRRLAVGLVEVTDINGSPSTGTESILAPGALGFKITPPGVLSIDARISGSSSEWAGRTPEFDCLYMTDIQWGQYNDPIQNPGSVGVFASKITNCTRRSSAFSGTGAQWIVLDNKAQFGTDPPFFSSLTFSWAIAFGNTAVPLPSPGSGSNPVPSPTPGGGNPQPSPSPVGNQPSPSPFVNQPSPSPFGNQPSPSPFVNQPSPSPGGNQPTTFGGNPGTPPPPPSPVPVPQGQVDCSDVAVFPQCLNAIFCQTGQTRTCLCDQTGTVLTKMCNGFVLPPSTAPAFKPPTQAGGAGVTTKAAAAGGNRCLQQCNEACGDRGVAACECNGDNPSMFKCPASTLSLSLAAIAAALLLAQ